MYWPAYHELSEDPPSPVKKSRFHGGPLDGHELEGDFSLVSGHNGYNVRHVYLESKHKGHFYYIGTRAEIENE